ncbi:MAG: STAS/SEC14 domain-containing protein [Sulfurovaceae bacterium]|nr:STAS/SEC14 domain-containing protein [Sulfurovaceae bacterium]
MFNADFDITNGIVTLQPHEKLSSKDFHMVSDAIDPYIEKHGKLNGIIIAVKSFPGWESLFAMISHFRFVKTHHDKVLYVAIVTDSIIGGLAEHIAGHFVNATIKHFAFCELDDAKNWIKHESCLLDK